VLIIGGAFAGRNAAKGPDVLTGIHVTLTDRTNYHLVQPLVHQVEMAGSSPADIAVPIHSILSKYRNNRVLQSTVCSLNLDPSRDVETERPTRSLVVLRSTGSADLGSL